MNYALLGEIQHTLSIFRSIALGAFLFLVLDINGNGVQTSPLLYMVYILSADFFVVQAILSRKKTTDSSFHWQYTSFFLEFIIITSGLYLNGGYRSDYLFIYLIPVATYALQFGHRFGWLATGLNSAAIVMFILYNIPNGLVPADHLYVSFSIIALMCLTSKTGAVLQQKEQSYSEQLIFLTQHDEMTGLHNLRYFNTYFQSQQGLAVRTGSPLSLIFIDLDNLRGHFSMTEYLMGNNLLINISSIIQQIVRERGLSFRYGDGTFAVVLPGTSQVEAVSLSTEIRTAVEGVCVSGTRLHRNKEITVITVVAGSPETSPRELIQVVVTALDQQKKGNRQAEDEYLQRSEKLALVGQLAAGLAHEIRNPLTAVKGFCQLAKDQSFTPKGKSYLEVILSELERVNTLVKEFLLLTRPAAPRMNPICIKTFLDDVVCLMTSNALLHDVGIQTDLSDDLPEVTADLEQLKQVIINLTINAIEAMPGGGILDISTYTAKDRQEVVIEVADTGVGIGEDTIKHIFEPFFTTKDGGSGLGLVIAHRIIESHGGYIHVTSRSGQGTTFTVHLPASSPAAIRTVSV